MDFASADGSAEAGLDYVSASGTLTWTDGDGADQTFEVEILNDSLAEGDETVLLRLENPSGAVLSDPSEAVLTIVDGSGGSINLTGGGCRLGVGSASPLSALFPFLGLLLSASWNRARRKK